LVIKRGISKEKIKSGGTCFFHFSIFFLTDDKN